MIQIHSNGSKWAGQEPDSIEKLIEVLADNTIEERFFHRYLTNPYAKEKHKYGNLCPIDSDFDGFTRFLGNFEEVSHVFRVDTDEPEVISRLSLAIRQNKGWKLYYQKNLVNIDGKHQNTNP